VTDHQDATKASDDAQPSALNPTANLPALSGGDAERMLQSVSAARGPRERQNTPATTQPQDQRVPAPAWMIYAIAALSAALVALIVIAVTRP
jgi:hypothetical protein